jgi:hypothetical protein
MTTSDAFCEDLKKITIEVPLKRKDGLILPPVPGNRYITDLLNDKVNGRPFFLNADSLAILSQNSNPKKLKITDVLTSKLNSTTVEKEKAKYKVGKRYKYYEMSIPIFSNDKKKAYVELGYHCGPLCGNGDAYFLVKTNGAWKIIKKIGTWIS